jgi:hypothetical protein
MSSIQLINSVVEWERRIEFDDERRKYHRVEPFANYLAALQPTQNENKSIFAKLLGRAKDPQPTPSTRKEKPCKDAQPC